MDVKKEILDFMKLRPETVAIIGYGSGVSPQKGQENRKPQIDLIVVVEDQKRWHLSNMKQNKKDYSFTSRLFFKYASNRLIKSGAKICYMTYIPFNQSKYKIGTIDEEDFLDDLNNWTTFYMAGRMQKPILIVKSTDEINKAIEENRKKAIEATKILCGDNISEKDFYTLLTSLSYIGDTRMGIAENPDKVKNIVEGRYEFYEDTYGRDLDVEDGLVDTSSFNLELLPDDLREILNSADSETLRNYLALKNKDGSFSQTLKGILTTGPVKALKYGTEKVKRKQRK